MALQGNAVACRQDWSLVAQAIRPSNSDLNSSDAERFLFSSSAWKEMTSGANFKLMTMTLQECDACYSKISQTMEQLSLKKVKGLHRSSAEKMKMFRARRQAIKDAVQSCATCRAKIAELMCLRFEEAQGSTDSQQLSFPGYENFNRYLLSSFTTKLEISIYALRFLLIWFCNCIAVRIYTSGRVQHRKTIPMSISRVQPDIRPGV